MRVLERDLLRVDGRDRLARGGEEEAEEEGDAFIGRDLNSGWNWQPTKYGWFASSKTSIRSPVVSRPTNSRPFASRLLTYSMFTS